MSISDLETSYKQLRTQNETITARRDVALETLAGLTTELKETFNCDSLEEAEALKKKLEGIKIQLATKIESSLASVLN